MPSYTPPSIAQLKRAAKRLARLEGLSHSHALDRIAAANGEPNWSLLMKHRAVETLEAARPPLAFSRTLDDVLASLRLVPHPRHGTRSDAARELVSSIGADLISPANALDYAIAYMSALLHVPRYRVASGSPAKWEMRCWLPYGLGCVADSADTRILVNRNYKPVGYTSDAFVRYQDFPDLHVRLPAKRLAQDAQAAGVTNAAGFFYDDGNPPWHSRGDAVAYREKLRRFRATLGG